MNAFFHAFPHSESFICFSDNSFEMKLWEIIPRQKQVFDWKTCKNVADFFAKIVDYKSSFTSRHSIGVAEEVAFHHEKLNGKGYPFGKTAAELNEPERIMACIDIYQALTEDRPYKKGLSHEKTCEMLDDMAQKGFVDSDISKKIRECFGRI